jgi:hypothetical protein
MQTERQAIARRIDLFNHRGRIADAQFAQGATDHLDDRIGKLLVHTQQTQRRTSLAGAAKRTLYHRVDNLFGQRAAVDPVKQTPAARPSTTSAAPTVSPGPCSRNSLRSPVGPAGACGCQVAWAWSA